VTHIAVPQTELFAFTGSPDVEMMVRTGHGQSCICLVMGCIRICAGVPELPWYCDAADLVKLITEGFYSIKYQKVLFV